MKERRQGICLDCLPACLLLVLPACERTCLPAVVRRSVSFLSASGSRVGNFHQPLTTSFTMGRNRPNKPKHVGASSSSSPISKFVSKIGVISTLAMLVAIGAQILVTGRFAGRQLPPWLGGAPPAPREPSAESSTRPRRPDGPPAVCPAGWPGCPNVAGVDWSALAELERSAAAAPPASSLRACEPEGAADPRAGSQAASGSLLSYEEVAGMHLVCVLPPPPGEQARVAAALASRVYLFLHLASPQKT